MTICWVALSSSSIRGRGPAMNRIVQFWLVYPRILLLSVLVRPFSSNQSSIGSSSGETGRPERRRNTDSSALEFSSGVVIRRLSGSVARKGLCVSGVAWSIFKGRHSVTPVSGLRTRTSGALPEGKGCGSLKSPSASLRLARRKNLWLLSYNSSQIFGRRLFQCRDEISWASSMSRATSWRTSSRLILPG
jgi:hypothetical protein